eukprot:TRINITY_DN17273_c0_g1_i1.p1 TRINITY_DN17273_c0_g1~~TRINITY_DN17273_c0_g1_i1.p1  ORF type:complete len:563 (-),score=85.90 TRINITY_DN17273_c0_g1_i1:302-1990(-)
MKLTALLSAGVGFPVFVALGLGYVVIRQRLRAKRKKTSLSNQYLSKIEAVCEGSALSLEESKEVVVKALPRLYVLDGLSSSLDAFVTRVIEEEQNLDLWQTILTELEAALAPLVKIAEIKEGLELPPRELLERLLAFTSGVDKILDQILEKVQQVRPFLIDLLERVAAETPEFEDNPETAVVLLEGFLKAGHVLAKDFAKRLEKATLVAPIRGEEIGISAHETLLPSTRKSVKVFYATERVRNPGGKRQDGDIYGTRSRDQLEYGYAEVELPESKSREEDAARREADPNYRIQTIIVNVEPAFGGDQKKFGDALEAETQQAGRTSEALLFLHGYNNGFADAVNRTAQVAYELDFAGVPVAYDWASARNPAKYVTDRLRVAATRFRLRDFLIFMSQLGLKKLHIVAHSMGNQALNKAFEELRHENKILAASTMTFAAPDVDSHEFATTMVPKVVVPCLNKEAVLTMYWADDDTALWYSFLAHGCRRRAGNALIQIECEKLFGIDGSAVSMSDKSFHHSYFGDSSRVLKDLRQAFLGCTALDHPRAAWLLRHPKFRQQFVLQAV